MDGFEIDDSIEQVDVLTQQTMGALNVMENRKVLLVNTVCGTGSVGRIMVGLYDVLEEHGYTCMMAYGRGTAPEGYRAYRIGNDQDVYLHGFMSRLTDRQAFFSAHATREFIKVIEDYDPDIVHLHNIHGYYLNIKLLFEYLKGSGRRIIWTLHDCWAFTGHCTHFEYIGCTKWMSECDGCEQLAEYPKSWFKDSSKKNYQQKKNLFTGFEDMTIVTPSSWLAARVQQSFLSQYHTVVIPTGIELEQFHPIQEERSDDNIIFQLKNQLGLRGKFILLGVANPWRERKGLAAFEVLAKALNERYAIVLLGLNDEQLSQLPESIIGLSKTDSVEELAALYSMADVYVNLTLEDTFPTTNIEALACGTPVVTFKAGGSPESLDETCGISVDRNSVQGVLAAIERIIAQRGVNYTREQCVNRAMLYSKENRFTEYISEVYDAF